MGARSRWKCASGKRRPTDKRGMAGYQTGSLAFAAACSREFWRASTIYGPSTDNGFRQPTGTSFAASSWSAIDIPASIAVQTNSSRPITSFRSAGAVPMPSPISRLPADPAICRRARRQWRTGATRNARLGIDPAVFAVGHVGTKCWMPDKEIRGLWL